MNLSRYIKNVASISSLLVLVLFKFQNCAPAPNMTSNFNGFQNNGLVQIVDQIAPTQIVFVTPSQKIPKAQTTLKIQGLCVGSERGQKIEFQVLDINEIAKIISQGEVECVGGGFEVHLDSVTFTSCTERVHVRAARVGDGQTVAETIIEPECSGT